MAVFVVVVILFAGFLSLYTKKIVSITMQWLQLVLVFDLRNLSFLKVCILYLSNVTPCTCLNCYKNCGTKIEKNMIENFRKGLS